MPGRVIHPEEAFAGSSRYNDPVLARRRAVLRETLDAFAHRADAFHAQAQANVSRWRAQTTAPSPTAPIVVSADWGEAALDLTRRYGTTFAVLNMANAYVPGGAYVEGTAAQEENLFRRTDAHFNVPDHHVAGDRYVPAMTDLLSAKAGRVYLDVERPRVCVRGAEDRSREDLDYRWLADDEVFPFFELRAAAQDCRNAVFDTDEARRRIDAQLDTLIDAGVRHAVLSAFGCGAFNNPPEVVAEHYRAALAARADQFEVLAFAIFHPGYGPDNHSVFKRVMSP